MARDLADLAASAGAAAAALKVAQKVGVRKAALMTTNEIRGTIRSATGDMRLSGVGKRGARVGAKFDIKGSTNPTALITATGPMQLIERDTSPHRIPRARGGRARRRYVVVDGHPYASANHPGTRGKRPFGKGVAKAAPHTGAIFQREIRSAIDRAWGL